jgi:GNAT superfamily N-acetyltransferase
MNIAIQQVQIDEILKLHAQIPEFDLPPDKTIFETRFNGKNPLLICAYINELPIGYLVAYDEYADKSYYCWLAAVLPAYRNQGALTALMNYLFTWAKKKNYKIIKIKTQNDKRDMLKFLVKNGFNFTNVETHENKKSSRIHLEKPIAP